MTTTDMSEYTRYPLPAPTQLLSFRVNVRNVFTTLPRLFQRAGPASSLRLLNCKASLLISSQFSCRFQNVCLPTASYRLLPRPRSFFLQRRGMCNNGHASYLIEGPAQLCIFLCSEMLTHPNLESSAEISSSISLTDTDLKRVTARQRQQPQPSSM